MGLGHEKLDVYRLSIDYVAWVYEQSAALTGIDRHARDQWLRASQSIPLNIAEGNGKTGKQTADGISRSLAARPWNVRRSRTFSKRRGGFPHR